MTPEEKYLKGIDLSTLPPQSGPVIVAVSQYSHGEQITAKCPQCQKILAIEDRWHAWLVSCECGHCKTTMKGILRGKKPK